jgi:hypothetical protein
MFGPDEGTQLISEVIHTLPGRISHLTVYYTIIQPWKIEEVYTYLQDRTWGSVPPVKFMQQLSPAYVHVCAWKYAVSGLAEGKDLALDGFQGSQTAAWDELRSFDFRVFHRGDTCNPILSAADLLVGAIDEQVGSGRFRGPVIEQSVRALNLGIPWSSEYIGIPHFRSIKPYTRKMIDTTPYIARPVYYILTEDRPENLSNKQARMQLELSDLYGSAVDAACASGGCIKLYDATEDVGGINRPGTVVTYYGDKGEALGEQLKTLYGVTTYDLRTDSLP